MSSDIVFKHFKVCDDVAEMIDREIHKGHMKKICSFINKWIGGAALNPICIFDNGRAVKSKFVDERRWAFWENVKGDWVNYELWEGLDNRSYIEILLWYDGDFNRKRAAGTEPWTPYEGATKMWFYHQNRTIDHISCAITNGLVKRKTCPELKAFLKENKVKGYSKMRKRELLNLCYKFPDCK